MSRDWMSTLWPASFRGVPFYIERDGATTGRRLAPTEYVDRDQPDFEDLGGAIRSINITGYVVGDFADAGIAALEAVCVIPGPGFLVLPAQGPTPARFKTLKRDRHRDKQGYFGFEAEFYFEGAATLAQPIEYLAQLAFDAAGALSAAAPAFLNGLTR